MGKVCRKCGVLKDVQDFPPNKRYKDGHTNECRDCFRIRDLAHYYKHHEKHKARLREYSSDIRKEHPERYREANRKVYAKNPEKYIEKALLWKKENPEKSKAIQHIAKQKRRYIVAEGNATVNDIYNLIKDSNNICFWCDTKTENIEIDHIIPLAKGGKHDIDNLVISCQKCNRKKHAKHPEQFLQEVLNA